jgi:small subunit ribosomal protein S3Ae
MAKGSKRGRVRDKWKDKKWIIVNAPSAFGGSPINYLPITDIENSKGRVIENTLYDIYKQDPNQHQTKVFLQIDKPTTASASTIFVGHEYAKEYLRSLVRHEIRLLIDKMLTEKIIQLGLDPFIQEVTLGGLSKELLVESKKIAFIRHIGIKKSKLISTPESRSIFEAKQIESPPTITA